MIVFFYLVMEIDVRQFPHWTFWHLSPAKQEILDLLWYKVILWERRGRS